MVKSSILIGSNMLWSYGVTTVPSRMDNYLLKTLNSLEKGGFDNPRLFIDGTVGGCLPAQLIKYEKTYRTPGLRAYGNWLLSALELYLREPNADRYAIFQDDFVTYVNLRQYLEQVEYPNDGYCNLYTFPQNEHLPRSGWYEGNKTQKGLGAVALVFSNEVIRLVLSSSYMIDRPLDAKRGHRLIDGGLVDAMKLVGYKEYVHCPSLVQHIGDLSTIQPPKFKHPQAKSFLGEETNALALLSKYKKIEPPKLANTANRIGLVGYNCDTGLGELNRQIATYADIDAWLIKVHPNIPTRPDFDGVDNIVCATGQVLKISQFMKMIDVALFCESTYFNELLPQAKKHRKRTVCVPMMEWMPAGAKGWPKLVDLFICPTDQCYQYFKGVVPCVYFPWPIDTERFQFKQRTVVKKFLFLGGHGGWKGRKGIDVIRKAKKLWPEFPIAVRTQQRINWDVNVQVLPPTKENKDLYSDGDVLLVPHSVDGLGLEPLEALSCGMPVVSTDGAPWNEYLQISRIRANTERRVVNRPVDWYLPDAESLVAVCKKLLGTDVTKQSQEAREWAEKHSWTKRKEHFIELVLHGKAT